MQGFNLLSLWRRESALLLCKRIPLKSIYAWPASISPLQWKGLNLTSASVMGNWTASFADRLLLIYRWTPFPAVSGRDPPKRAFPVAGPLFQPPAAEILQKGAPQPDVKLASIWIFFVALPHTGAVPGVSSLCSCPLCL